MDDLAVLEANMATNRKWPSSVFSRTKNHSEYLSEGFCRKLNDFGVEIWAGIDEGHFRLVAMFASNVAKLYI